MFSPFLMNFVFVYVLYQVVLMRWSSSYLYCARMGTAVTVQKTDTRRKYKAIQWLIVCCRCCLGEFHDTLMPLVTRFRSRILNSGWVIGGSNAGGFAFGLGTLGLFLRYHYYSHDHRYSSQLSLLQIDSACLTFEPSLNAYNVMILYYLYYHYTLQAHPRCLRDTVDPRLPLALLDKS